MDPILVLGDTLPQHLADLQRQHPQTAWRLLRHAPYPYNAACLVLVRTWLGDADQSVAATTYLQTLIDTRSGARRLDRDRPPVRVHAPP